MGRHWRRARLDNGQCPGRCVKTVIVFHAASLLCCLIASFTTFLYTYSLHVRALTRPRQTMDCGLHS